MTTSRLLLIEDEVNLLNSLSFILRQQNFTVMEAQTGEQGVALALQDPPDLALVDIGLPGIDGFAVAVKLTALRRNGLKIIFLTGSNDEDDIVRALEGLADDYIVKPVRPRVLLARIQSCLQHVSVPVPGDEVVICCPLHMDVASIAARLDGHLLCLTPTEFNVLLLLARHPETAMNRSQIMALHGFAGSRASQAVAFFALRC